MTLIFNINADNVEKAINCVELGQICKTYFGIQAYDRKASISNVKSSDKYLPLIDGADIHPYLYATPKIYFNYLPENIKSGGDWKVYSRERIVVRQIGSVPIVGLCKENILASNTLYSVYPKDESYNLLYILACLNSSYIKNYWKARYSDNKATFPKIKGFQLKGLPIPIATKEQQQSIIKLASEIVAIKTADKDNPTNIIETELDKIISMLYFEK